ncbi:MAG TPA: CHRD domain-containing protein [Gemmatimonadota bacterium]|nr:CHRD domain-containing protein [Gemmatimonadota bacterium]
MRSVSMITRFLAIALIATLATAGECDDDDDPTGPGIGGEFDATLTGAAERPDPVTTDASGSATIDVDEDGGSFEVEVEDIQDVTFAHIHIGDANTAGPISVFLFDAGGNPVDFTDRETLATGTFDETDIDPASGVDTMEELIEAMENGNAYVNVHTTANPLGEIRGQLSD